MCYGFEFDGIPLFFVFFLGVCFLVFFNAIFLIAFNNVAAITSLTTLLYLLFSRTKFVHIGPYSSGMCNVMECENVEYICK